MLHPSRTEFANGARNVFHFVPNGSAVYEELADKYGADYVFRGNGATDGAVLTKILGMIRTGGNDVIRLYPGTFVAGAVVTIAKIGVTIEGALENAAAIVWDCDTTDCAAFSITAAGVTLRNFSIDQPAAGTTDTITSTANGTIIDNIIVQGGAIVNSNATFLLSGAYSMVKNCRLHLVNKGIFLKGSNSYAEGNWIDGTGADVSYFGIKLGGDAAKTAQVARNNSILLSGATSCSAIVVLASADLASVYGNFILANGDPLVVEADTYGAANVSLNATIATTPTWIAE